MEENKTMVTEETMEMAESIKEEAAETAKEVAEKAIEAAKGRDPLSIILLVVAAIGLLATGGWVVWLAIKIVKKIKAKINDSKVTVKEEFSDEKPEEEKTE